MSTTNYDSWNNPKGFWAMLLFLLALILLMGLLIVKSQVPTQNVYNNKGQRVYKIQGNRVYNNKGQVILKTNDKTKKRKVEIRKGN